MLNQKLPGCVHPFNATGSEFYSPDDLSVYYRQNQRRLVGKPERHLSHHKNYNNLHIIHLKVMDPD